MVNSHMLYQLSYKGFPAGNEATQLLTFPFPFPILAAVGLRLIGMSVKIGISNLPSRFIFRLIF